VFLDGELYRMWFCFRGRAGFRTSKGSAYRIGYAESRDGIAWVRDDSRCGIVSSEAGWDSEMIAYPHVVSHSGRTYMFYNGNGFGRSGFGYAVMERG
jgi:hypothetical protein